MPKLMTAVAKLALHPARPKDLDSAPGYKVATPHACPHATAHLHELRIKVANYSAKL